MSISSVPTNCTDCAFHRVIQDQDPTDWFNDDDVAVVCSKMNNPSQDKRSASVANRQDRRIVTSMCRPYRTQEESDTSKWCPLKPENQVTQVG
jgi:hypothetical protein